MKNHDEKQDYNSLLQFSMVVHVQTNMINLWMYLLTFHIKLVWSTMS